MLNHFSFNRLTFNQKEKELSIIRGARKNRYKPKKNEKFRDSFVICYFVVEILVVLSTSIMNNLLLQPTIMDEQEEGSEKKEKKVLFFLFVIREMNEFLSSPSTPSNKMK